MDRTSDLFHIEELRLLCKQFIERTDARPWVVELKCGCAHDIMKVNIPASRANIPSFHDCSCGLNK